MSQYTEIQTYPKEPGGRFPKESSVRFLVQAMRPGADYDAGA